MQVKQCRMCGMLFQSLGNQVCPACADKLDAEFRLVRDYVYDHPQAGILEISEQTGVSEKNILGFLKEERLILSDESGGGLCCEQCGKPVSSGKICAGCREKLSKVLDNALDAWAAAQAKKPGQAAGIEKQGRKRFDMNTR